MRAMSDQGTTLFGRYCETLKDVKKEVINHKWILKINHVVYKKRIYTMKEVFLL